MDDSSHSLNHIKCHINYNFCFWISSHPNPSLTHFLYIPGLDPSEAPAASAVAEIAVAAPGLRPPTDAVHGEIGGDPAGQAPTLGGKNRGKTWGKLGKLWKCWEDDGNPWKTLGKTSGEDL